MSEHVLGIDIAKQKLDAALLIGGKLKHKSCKNSTEGFELLSQRIQPWAGRGWPAASC